MLERGITLETNGRVEASISMIIFCYLHVKWHVLVKICSTKCYSLKNDISDLIRTQVEDN